MEKECSTEGDYRETNRNNNMRRTLIKENGEPNHWCDYSFNEAYGGSLSAPTKGDKDAFIAFRNQVYELKNEYNALWLLHKNGSEEAKISNNKIRELLIQLLIEVYDATEQFAK